MSVCLQLRKARKTSRASPRFPKSCTKAPVSLSSRKSKLLTELCGTVVDQKTLGKLEKRNETDPNQTKSPPGSIIVAHGEAKLLEAQLSRDNKFNVVDDRSDSVEMEAVWAGLRAELEAVRGRPQKVLFRIRTFSSLLFGREIGFLL